MAVVQAPDGSTVQFPDGMSTEDMNSAMSDWWAKKQSAAAPSAPSAPVGNPDRPNGFNRAVASVVPFGKDVGAAGEALGEMTNSAIRGSPMPSFSESWQRNRAQDVADNDAYIAAHPILGRVAEGFGLLTGMGGAPEAAAAKVQPALAARLQDGTRIGAIYGAGNGDGDLPNRVVDAGIGALGGAVVAGVAPSIVRGAADIVNKIMPPSEDAIQKKVGQVLIDKAGGAVTAFPLEPLPGMKLTPGQLSNNPGLLHEEDAANQTLIPAKVIFSNAQEANNGAIRRAIGQLGDLNSADQAPAMMQARLEAAQQSGKAAYQKAWNAIGLDDKAPIPSAPLKQAVGDYLDTLAPIERTQIPIDWLKGVEDLGDNTSLKELQAYRSYIDNAGRMAYRSGDANTARIVGGLSDIMESHTEDPALIGADNVDQNYQAARDATRQFKQTFVQPAPVRNALGVDRYGADKIPISAVADTFINSGKGGPEALQSYLDAVTVDPTASGVAKYDPQAVDAARSAFAAKMLSNVENTAEDQGGNKLVSNAKLSKFVDDYSHVINSDLFTPAQRNLIENIQDASQMSSRSGANVPGGGSATVSRLSGGGSKYLDALMGTWPSRLIGSTAGAVAGSFGGVPGTIAGAALGGAGGDALVNALYRAPQEKMVQILNEALHDPKLAQSLMTRATSGQQALPAPTRQYLWSVLSGPGAGELAAQHKQELPASNQ